MMKKSIAIAMLLSLYMVTANASDACKNAVSDGELFACHNTEKTTAEKALNAEYQAAQKRIDEAYNASPNDKVQYLKILRDAQLGWLKYRDSQCELVAFLAEKGSIAHESLFSQCIARIDNLRITELKEIPYQ